jgi:hypothetical protein
MPEHPRSPSRLRLVIGAALAVLSLASAGSPARAADEPEPDVRWRIILEQQLMSEKTCQLHELLMFNELRIGDGIALEGRVSCIDGRMFDFSRPRPHQKFEIRLCEPAVC